MAGSSYFLRMQNINMPEKRAIEKGAARPAL